MRAVLIAAFLLPLAACGPSGPEGPPERRGPAAGASGDSAAFVSGDTAARESGDAAAFAAMDSVYGRFVRAYRLGEPDSVVALYTDGPLYLPGRGPVVAGRRALRSQFAFLERIRADSATAHLSFESVERGASGDLAWEVGYYTLQVERADGSRTDPTRGKFTTVWRRDGQDRWRIHVDAFSPAPPPED